MVLNVYKDQYDVDISTGYFSNPVKLGEYCRNCREVHSTPQSTLLCFKVYFQNRLKTDHEFKQRVLELKGKTLGCFCATKNHLTISLHPICHGQIILEYLNVHI